MLVEDGETVRRNSSEVAVDNGKIIIFRNKVVVVVVVVVVDVV